jgi:alpha-L-fucosidase
MVQKIATPTDIQIEWANHEIGAIIHCDIPIFDPNYRFLINGKVQTPPNVKIFHPSSLDTDQWIKTIKSAGCKYAVLTAKHVTGFTLFPDLEYEYSIASTPYKEGKGDIIQEFVDSCRKYDVKPGIYYSCEANAYLGIHKGSGNLPPYPSKEWGYFADLVTRHLTQLWSEYGDLFELWFDGGTLENGPDILGLLKKHQPNAICFQGPEGYPSRIRWVGNESGLAPYPCWSTTDYEGAFDGTEANSDVGNGHPDGTSWVPAETDVPIRFREWFWRPNQDFLVPPPGILVKWYNESVGRNSNLLLGVVIDDRGLIPDEDARVLKEFGEVLEKRKNSAVAETAGEGLVYKLQLEDLQDFNQIVLMENFSNGHRVRAYEIKISKDGVDWDKIYSGSAIGHKHIINLDTLSAKHMELIITQSEKTPNLLKFGIYNVERLEDEEDL